MKNLKENNAPLSRAEMSKVKGGGVDCSAVDQQCHPSCGHFSSDYSRFAPCVGSLGNNQCSPLAGWYAVCGNYN